MTDVALNDPNDTAEMTRKLNEVESYVRTLEHRFAVLHIEYEEQRQRVSESERKVSELEKKNKVMQDDIKSKQMCVDSSQKCEDQDVSALKCEIQNLRLQLSEKDDLLLDRNNLIQISEQWLREKEIEIERLHKVIAEYEIDELNSYSHNPKQQIHQIFPKETELTHDYDHRPNRYDSLPNTKNNNELQDDQNFLHDTVQITDTFHDSIIFDSKDLLTNQSIILGSKEDSHTLPTQHNPQQQHELFQQQLQVQIEELKKEIGNQDFIIVELRRQLSDLSLNQQQTQGISNNRNKNGDDEEVNYQLHILELQLSNVRWQFDTLQNEISNTKASLLEQLPSDYILYFEDVWSSFTKKINNMSQLLAGTGVGYIRLSELENEIQDLSTQLNNSQGRQMVMEEELKSLRDTLVDREDFERFLKDEMLRLKVKNSSQENELINYEIRVNMLDASYREATQQLQYFQSLFQASDKEILSLKEWIHASEDRANFLSEQLSQTTAALNEATSQLRKNVSEGGGDAELTDQHRNRYNCDQDPNPSTNSTSVLDSSFLTTEDPHSSFVSAEDRSVTSVASPNSSFMTMFTAIFGSSPPPTAATATAAANITCRGGEEDVWGELDADSCPELSGMDREAAVTPAPEHASIASLESLLDALDTEGIEGIGSPLEGSSALARIDYLTQKLRQLLTQLLSTHSQLETLLTQKGELETELMAVEERNAELLSQVIRYPGEVQALQSQLEDRDEQLQRLRRQAEMDREEVNRLQVKLAEGELEAMIRHAKTVFTSSVDRDGGRAGSVRASEGELSSNTRALGGAGTRVRGFRRRGSGTVSSHSTSHRDIPGVGSGTGRLTSCAPLVPCVDGEDEWDRVQTGRNETAYNFQMNASRQSQSSASRLDGSLAMSADGSEAPTSGAGDNDVGVLVAGSEPVFEDGSAEAAFAEAMESFGDDDRCSLLVQVAYYRRKLVATEEALAVVRDLLSSRPPRDTGGTDEEDRVTDLSKQITSMRHTLDLTIDELERVKEVNSSLEMDLQAARDELQLQEDGFNQRLADINNLMKLQKDRFDTVANAAKESEAKVIELKSQIKKLVDRELELENAILQAGSAVRYESGDHATEGFKSAVNMLMAQVAELKSQLETKKKAMALAIREKDDLIKQYNLIIQEQQNIIENERQLRNDLEVKLINQNVEFTEFRSKLEWEVYHERRLRIIMETHYQTKAVNIEESYELSTPSVVRIENHMPVINHNEGVMRAMEEHSEQLLRASRIMGSEQLDSEGRMAQDAFADGDFDWVSVTKRPSQQPSASGHQAQSVERVTISQTAQTTLANDRSRRHVPYDHEDETGFQLY